MEMKELKRTVHPRDSVQWKCDSHFTDPWSCQSNGKSTIACHGKNLDVASPSSGKLTLDEGQHEIETAAFEVMSFAVSCLIRMWEILRCH